MTNQEYLFESPVAHETSHEGYSNPEYEWETQESHYSSPYSSPYSNPEAEWETHESHYSSPYSSPYSNPEAEWESHETHYSSPYSSPYSNPEAEWESHETHYSSPYSSPEYEWEDEGEYFFKGVWNKIKKVGKFVAPLAKRFAPFAAKALVGMIPGVGAILGPVAGQLTQALLKEGEMEAEHMEAELFGAHEGEYEVGASEAAQQAALAEFMAAQAAEAETSAEAEAILGASLPITITIMGGRRALRPVIPVLSQATGRLASVLRRGPAGRDLLRAIPTIQRHAIGTLHAAARAGQPITAPLAIRALAGATRRVLSTPRIVSRAVERNMILRQRMAPTTPRRTVAYQPSRPTPVHPRRAPIEFRPAARAHRRAVAEHHYY